MKTLIKKKIRRLLPRLIARMVVMILSMPTGHWEADSTLPALQHGPVLTIHPAIEIVTLSSQPNQVVVSGRVSDVDVSTHYVAVYALETGKGWSIQPSLAQPRVFIRRDNCWGCRIRLSASSAKLMELRAYLLPDSCSPPLLEGAQVLPSSLDSAAVARTGG
jgi:hypothetical protein